MNEAELNKFLLLGRKASEKMRKRGKKEIAERILQVTSLVALRQLPKSYKVICQCGLQLKDGKEVEFYNYTGKCYRCDSVQTDYLEDQMKDLENTYPLLD